MESPPSAPRLLRSLGFASTMLALGWMLLALGAPASAQAPALDDAVASRVLFPEAPQGPPPPPPFDLETPCSDGAVRDDGTVETGYSWVPSVESGIYAQLWERDEISPPGVDSVCVCWLRTRPDDVIDFEVVFFADSDDDGVPDLEPFAAIPSTATGVPEGVTGRFFEVDTSGVDIPHDGPVFIGARWDASVDQFFFVCADRSPETPFTEVFFIDDLAEEWGAAGVTLDPTFTEHRAIFVRPVPRAPTPVEVPTSTPWGRVSTAAALLLAGLLALRTLRA